MIAGVGRSQGWLALGAALALALACAPGSGPAPTPTPPRATPTAAGTATRTAAPTLPARVSATPTTPPTPLVTQAPVVPRTPTPADQPTSGGSGPYGLVGQELAFCVGRPQAFDFLVEQVEVADHPDGGRRVLVVVRASNVGTMAGGTFRTTEVVDERGRHFEQTGIMLSGLDLRAVRSTYNVDTAAGGIQPGETGREAWAFVVAPDVERLTLVAAPRQGCDRPPVVVPTNERLASEHATNILRGTARLTATAESRAIDRAEARRTGKDYGLVGQSLRFCAGIPDRIPFEAVVERADGIELPGNRLRVVAVVNATNAGAREGGTFRGTRVRDDKARLTNQVEVGGVNYTEVARELEVEAPMHQILPGLSERQVWVFHVAPDAEQLTLSQAPDYQCRGPATARPAAQAGPTFVMPAITPIIPRSGR